MIICSCNVISDRDVRTCVKPYGAPAESAREVFRHMSCLPKCGRCVRNIHSLCEREAAAQRSLAKGPLREQSFSQPSETQELGWALAAE